MRIRTLALTAMIVAIAAFPSGAQTLQGQEVTVRNENLNCKIQVQVLQGEVPIAFLLVQPDKDITTNVSVDPTGREITFRVLPIGCPFLSYQHSERVDPRRGQVTLTVATNPTNTWVALTKLRQ